jgi:kynureninase
MDKLLEWRKEFPILENTVYMISHSLGAMPRGVYDKMHEYADMWATRGIRAWAEGWWEMPVTVGDKIAQIIGADAGEVAMHQNVSICQSLILSCFDLTPPRNKIVYSTLNFPSVMYVYEAHARKAGAQVQMVESEDGITVDLEKMLAAIDEQTLLVPISHVLFKSSYLQNAKEIIKRAHDVGAYVVLDVYQSAGTVPFNVKELDVDFVVGGSVKWLCGGPGAGYLYVHPALRSRLEPCTTGWQAHADPFAFEIGPIRYASNAFRFLHGSPHIPCLYAAQSGYDIINQIGVEQIRAKSIHQTSRLIDLALAEGWRVPTPRAADQRGGVIIIDLPQAAAVAKELIRREILVDYRPGAGIRIAPHFYTKDEELDITISTIKQILESRAYEAHISTTGLKI